MSNKDIKPPGLMLPLEWHAMIMAMDDRTVAQLIRAAMDYMQSEKEPEKLDKNVRPIFAILRPRIDYQISSYRNRVKIQTENIKKRWEKVKNDSKNEVKNKNKNTTVFHGIPPYSLENDGIPANTISKLNKINLNNTILTDSNNINISRAHIATRNTRVRYWLKVCINRFYHRRKSTVWSKPEEDALSIVCRRPDVWHEFRVIAAAYTGGYQYFRKDIITLLRNWSTELDRTQSYNMNREKEVKNVGNDLSDRYGMQ